jgi:hypothetical protein
LRPGGESTAQQAKQREEEPTFHLGRENKTKFQSHKAMKRQSGKR